MTTVQWQDRITIDAGLHHGEPCIKGTRIPVAVIVATLAEMPLDNLLQQFPQITREDVKACLYFAAEASRNTLVA